MMADKVKVQELDTSTQELLLRHYEDRRHHARFGDTGCIMPFSYKEDADNIRNMAVRPDDVWVTSFPRSGTTLTQELVWLLMTDFDYDTASKIPLKNRFFFLELTHLSPRAQLLSPEMRKTMQGFPTFEAIANAPSPRFIKTHLPFSLLPPNLLDTTKVVYLARDPRDVVVSFYHHHKLLKTYGGDFKSYWNLFINDLIRYCPFFSHLKQAWALRDHPNMLFLFYEDMTKDLPSYVKRIADLQGKSVTNEQVMKLCEHLDINNFRKNASVNQAWLEKLNPNAESFVRKDTMGDKVRVQELDPSTQEFLMSHYKGRWQHARFGDVGCIMPVSYKEDADNIRNMAARPDDVCVITFPRSGTTWTQELVWLLMNDFDYDTASKIPLRERYLFIELGHVTYKDKPGFENLDHGVQEVLARSPNFEAIANAPSPRFIKTHLPFSLLPPNLLDTSKVVYVARDPRDVAISYYHLSKLLYNFEGDFGSYWKLFINDLVTHSPYFPHLKKAWALRGHPNMLFLFYEDMSKDLPSCIKKIADFLGKTVTDQQIKKLCEHLDINNFRKNDSVNPPWMAKVNPNAEGFVRKGKTGGWREHFDAEMTAQAQRWLQENLADTDLRFPCEI